MGFYKVKRLLAYIPVIFLLWAGTALASCPVPYAGQYHLGYDNSTNFLTACKFGDSLRNVCGVVAGGCAAADEGKVEYFTGGNVLRYCNGTNWTDILCETLTSCSGTTAGTISADATQMKYCDGTAWQAMYNDGICTGIGVQEAIFTPTPATAGEDTTFFAWESGASMTDDYAVVGAYMATRNYIRDGNATIFKRSGTTWARLKELVPSPNDSWDHFGLSTAMDGDYAVVGAHNRRRFHVFKKDHGGADNWGQIASQSNTGSYFAKSVDIEDDLIISGAYGYDGGTTNKGRAYIYRKDSGGSDNWGLVETLEHPEPATHDNFGWYVAIAGDIAMVSSAHRNEGGPSNSGVVYLFHETSPDNWTYLKKLVNPHGFGTNDYFGHSIDIKDLDGNGTADRLIVGTPYDDTNGGDRGAVFVFERNSGGSNNWGHTGTASMTSTSSYHIGREARLAGDRIIAGSRINDQQAYDAGAVLAFRKDLGGANNWGLEDTMYASDASARDELGRSVAVSETGNYAIGGAPYHINAGDDPGKAYVFKRSGTSWSEEDQLTPPNTEFAVRMGDAVDVSGDYAATGIIYKTDEWNANRRYAVGGVNIYKRSPTATWSLEKHITPPTSSWDMQFGMQLGISSSHLIVAIPGDDSGGSNSGGALVFGRNVGGPSNWGYIKKIKPSDSQSHDWAGSENGLSLFGDYLALGARYEDGSLVNPQGNAGAAYIFKKNLGGTDNWGEVKKIAPPAEESEARFGSAVALGGTYLAVGARYEDTNGANAGAVYLYEKDHGGSDNWGYLNKKFIGESAHDHFGYDVAIAGTTMAIGAPYDDDAGGDKGAVYIHYKDQGGADNWGQFKKITYPGTSSGNALFGKDVDLAGDILIVGAPYDDTNVTNGGYVYVFSRNEGGNDNWGLLATIDPNTPGAEDLFGWSVAVSGNVVAGGGIYNDDGGKDDGAIYVFGCPP